MGDLGPLDDLGRDVRRDPLQLRLGPLDVFLEPPGLVAPQPPMVWTMSMCEGLMVDWTERTRTCTPSPSGSAAMLRTAASGKVEAVDGNQDPLKRDRLSRGLVRLAGPDDKDRAGGVVADVFGNAPQEEPFHGRGAPRGAEDDQVGVRRLFGGGDDLGPRIADPELRRTVSQIG